ncbi:response regulator receiver modulated metal dependent phosphohydrolase [Thiorhodococcus drewsii AZ1]|uniref:Response regulator receiver modulated metal dependent phosphohydrolase n=1 Tax=Thiorhodococcus drewsii AZ1 TaxID=765913 RepID=G2E1S8_9GAMM|nr:HD domain-containing phosphohydrolase [Thiorhodococcus drewsii]EGV31136.1 response regulator receiver modulated metal dependent phosphohydrolase [Thiorhodococcus drewsii AZ1]
MTRNGPLLVVDDEPQNLAAIRQVLGNDYPLIFCRNGAEALVAAVRCQPSLILLDIQMPHMDGFEVCRTLKADPITEAIPIIFVTGLNDVGDEAAGFDAGAVDYIIKPLSPPIVRARIRTHLSLVHASRLENSYADALSMLGEAGHYNDTDTGVHIWRMAAYASEIATACGWSQAERDDLKRAAPMHDTGKIGIPGEILRKPGKLDPHEWEIMKQHSRIGYEILCKSQAPLFQLAAEVALRHHEKWDGSGYPDGLAGDQIPESARIVAIADVFDALTMRRPYKDAWPIERAVQTIREGAGSHFEPRLMECFMDILPRIMTAKEEWDAREE